MKVEQFLGNSDEWCVVDNDGRIIRKFPTNAEAWKYLDRVSNQAMSPKEDLANYIWERDLGIG
jgi:hypothetical protein